MLNGQGEASRIFGAKFNEARVTDDDVTQLIDAADQINGVGVVKFLAQILNDFPDFGQFCHSLDSLQSESFEN